MSQKRRFATDAELNEYKMHVWNHNATYGRVVNARKCASFIADHLESASPDAKQAAHFAAAFLDLLEEELRKHRVEPDGTLVTIKRTPRNSKDLNNG